MGLSPPLPRLGALSGKALGLTQPRGPVSEELTAKYVTPAKAQVLCRVSGSWGTLTGCCLLWSEESGGSVGTGFGGCRLLGHHPGKRMGHEEDPRVHLGPHPFLHDPGLLPGPQALDPGLLMSRVQRLYPLWPSWREECSWGCGPWKEGAGRTNVCAPSCYQQS